MHDVDSFYNFHVLQACLKTHEYAVVPINPQLVVGIVEIDFLSNCSLMSADISNLKV